MRPLPAVTAATALLLSACTPTQPIVQVPKIQVQDVQLTRLDLPGGLASLAAVFNGLPGAPVAHILMDLQVTNPNPLPLRMTNIAADLIIDGQNMGRVDLPNVDLPARGATQQLAEIALPVSAQTAQNILKVARGQLVTYRLDGTFSVNMGLLGVQTFGPYTLSQGQWKQKAVINF